MRWWQIRKRDEIWSENFSPILYWKKKSNAITGNARRGTLRSPARFGNTTLIREQTTKPGVGCRLNSCARLRYGFRQLLPQSGIHRCDRHHLGAWSRAQYNRSPASLAEISSEKATREKIQTGYAQSLPET